MGIILLYVRAANIDKASLWYTMIGDLASALLICGAVSLLQEIFTNDESYRKIMNLFKVSEAVKDSGLNDIKTDSNDYNFKDHIRGSENFYTIMNDGLRWVETNLQHWWRDLVIRDIAQSSILWILREPSLLL